MQTMREWLHENGLATSPTGRGKFTNAQRVAIQEQLDKGMTFASPANRNQVRSAVAVVDRQVISADIDTSVVRQWARDNGIDVGIRGRLSPDVIGKYLSAHGGHLPERQEKARELPTVNVMRDGNEVAVEYNPADVREYGRANGFEVALKGRVPRALLAAYVADKGLGSIDLPEDAPEPAEEPSEPQITMTEQPVSLPRDGNRLARLPEQPVREQTSVYWVENGTVIALQSCGKCKTAIRSCTCSNGPHVPAWIDSTMPVALLEVQSA